MIETEENSKIYWAVRSLYRYFQLKKETATPDILVETESKILLARLKELSADEIYQLFLHWPEFYKKQLEEDAIQDKLLEDDFDKMVSDLN